MPCGLWCWQIYQILYCWLDCIVFRPRGITTLNGNRRNTSPGREFQNPFLVGAWLILPDVVARNRSHVGTRNCRSNFQENSENAWTLVKLSTRRVHIISGLTQPLLLSLLEKMWYVTRRYAHNHSGYYLLFSLYPRFYDWLFLVIARNFSVSPPPISNWKPFFHCSFRRKYVHFVCGASHRTAPLRPVFIDTSSAFSAIV